MGLIIKLNLLIMNKNLIVILVLITIISSCTRLEIEKETPKCVKDEIVRFDKEQKCNDIRVDEYIFQGNTVYVFVIGSSCGADMQSNVIDTACTSLGALGGLAGIVEINGENFNNAVFTKTVRQK